MDQKDRYDPEVYKRLELVRKQFQANQAEERKKQSSERRQQRLAALSQNKIKIGRIVLYALLIMILVAVIAVAISGALK